MATARATKSPSDLPEPGTVGTLPRGGAGVAGGVGDNANAETDDMLAELAGQEIERLIAADTEDSSSAASAQPSNAPAAGASASESDLDNEIIEAVLREANVALNTDLDAVPRKLPRAAPKPKVVPTAEEEAALASELDALFAELNEGQPPAVSKGASESDITDAVLAADAAESAPVPVAVAPAVAEPTVDDAATQAALDAVFDELVKSDMPPAAEAPSTAAGNTAQASGAAAPVKAPAAPATPPSPPAPTRPADEPIAGASHDNIAGELLKDVESDVAETDARYSSQPLVVVDAAGGATAAASPKRKSTTHKGPPFAGATADWNPAGISSSRGLLDELPEIEHRRSDWVVKPLVWLNHPFDFLSPEARENLGKLAIFTLFNSAVILFYVWYIRR